MILTAPESMLMRQAWGDVNQAIFKLDLLAKQLNDPAAVAAVKAKIALFKSVNLNPDAAPWADKNSVIDGVN